MMKEFRVSGVDFLVGHSAGSNAGGLIGTEFNGIFLFCLTDKRMVLDEYLGQGRCYQLNDGHRAQVEREIERISQMNKERMEDFLSTRAAYNPFADRRRRTKATKGDRGVRKKYSVSNFTQGRWLSPGDKRTLVHDLEKLLVSRIFGGAAFARSRFSPKLYNLLSLHYGHIAHYNRGGFYEAQLENGQTFMTNVRRIADGLSLYGYPAGCDDDLRQALMVVAGAYKDCSPID